MAVPGGLGELLAALEAALGRLEAVMSSLGAVLEWSWPALAQSWGGLGRKIAEKRDLCAHVCIYFFRSWTPHEPILAA